MLDGFEGENQQRVVIVRGSNEVRYFSKRGKRQRLTLQAKSDTVRLYKVVSITNTDQSY